MLDNQSLQNLFIAQGTKISIVWFVLNLLLAGALGYCLKVIYAHCGRALSNRNEFGRNFVLIAMTTMVIISIVKSSLALSLGLVGALSIVRFRAAIKEPEELSFLFLAVSIGLGCGAGQGLITLIAFLVIGAVIYVRTFTTRDEKTMLHHNLLVTSLSPSAVPFPKIRATIEQSASSHVLQRLDESEDRLEAAFLVNFESSAHLERCTEALRTLGGGVQFSFLIHRNLTG